MEETGYKAELVPPLNLKESLPTQDSIYSNLRMRNSSILKNSTSNVSSEQMSSARQQLPKKATSTLPHTSFVDLSSHPTKSKFLLKSNSKAHLRDSLNATSSKNKVTVFCKPQLLLEAFPSIENEDVLTRTSFKRKMQSLEPMKQE